MFYLMIKEIEQTGLKYLCKRKLYENRPDDHIKYKGSGLVWRRILNAHPEYTIKTEVLGVFDENEIKEKGIFYSRLFNVVESKEWANLIEESGDGGDTSKTAGFISSMKNKKKDPLRKIRKTIHNPITGEIRRILPGVDLPDGFLYGGMPGLNFGPRKGETEVYHNGSRKIYLRKGEIPPSGFVKGLHYEGTTKGKLGYFNPDSGEKIYINPESSPPDGFVRGIMPTTGKKISTPHGIYNSIQACMKDKNLSRHHIEKLIKTTEEWNYL